MTGEGGTANQSFPEKESLMSVMGGAPKSSAWFISERGSSSEFLNISREGGGGREFHNEVTSTEFWAVFYHS